MMNKISSFILHIFYTYDIEVDDPELFLYGTRVLIRNLFILLFALFISLYFGFYTIFLIFNVSFLLFRQLTGGYHAKHATTCFIQSILMILLAPYLLQSVNNTFSIISTIFLIPLLCFISMKGFSNGKAKLTCICLIIMFLFMFINDSFHTIIFAAALCDVVSYLLSNEH